MKTLLHRLLNSSDELTSKILDELQPKDLFLLRDALVVLWQIHPSEEVKDKASLILKEKLEDDEIAIIEATFSVFKSVSEFLPWMGEYKDLQVANFQNFYSKKEHYEPLLVSSSLVDVYLDLGRKLYMMFDLVDEAKSCFEGIVKYDIKNAEAFYALGRLTEREQNHEEALRFYENCIDIDPNHIYALLQLGILNATVFMAYNEAIIYYNRVIELEPFMAETHVRLAQVHYQLKDIKRAKQFIEIALGINEFNEEALNLLGQIQFQWEGNIEKAIETFKKGLDNKVHGDSGLLLSSLGELYSNQLGDFEKARAFYEKSLKARPTQNKTLKNLIVILENNYQDYAAVSMCYEKYLTHVKNDLSVYVDYAKFLIKYMQDYEFAQMQLNEVFALDPEHEEAVKVKRQINQLLLLENDEIDDDHKNNMGKDKHASGDENNDDFDFNDFHGGGAAADN
ncbi:MAG: hypothetical protein MK207_02850 [Saprospiraceae bacterium]|nr:hypothetical protein [Saprospiraceae bacterium]